MIYNTNKIDVGIPISIFYIDDSYPMLKPDYRKFNIIKGRKFAFFLFIMYNPFCGDYTMKIDKVNEPIVAVRTSQYPEDNKSEFLLLGRSNVGKSSFINAIINRKNFAHVSSNPGKTQTLNFYLINDLFYFVDVPGYGYANVSKDTQQKFGLMIEEYLVNRTNLKHIFMLIDSRHAPSKDDLLMYNFLKYYNLKVTIVATKFDKIKANAKAKQEKLLLDTLQLKEEDKLVLFSSINKKGKELIYKVINENLYTCK